PRPGGMSTGRAPGRSGWLWIAGSWRSLPAGVCRQCDVPIFSADRTQKGKLVGVVKCAPIVGDVLGLFLCVPGEVPTQQLWPIGSGPLSRWFVEPVLVQQGAFGPDAVDQPTVEPVSAQLAAEVHIQLGRNIRECRFQRG